jgi:oligoendopeptidase F
MTSQIPTRAEIADPDKWDLTHLFSNVDKWKEDFRWIEQTYPQIKEWKGRLGQSAKNLADCLEF